MSMWGQMSFQDPVSLTIEHISSVHDSVIVVVVFILSIVLYTVFAILTSKSWNLLFISSEMIEVIWISIPSMVLVALAFPSLHCLYLMEEVIFPVVSAKVIGHQWFWSYEGYSESEENIDFSSYINSDLLGFDPRLLSCDYSLKAVCGLETRLLVSSADVIHSWTVPSLGVNVDAIPGRINQIGFTPIQVGEFFGQCSEICGAMHSFMPISVNIVPQ